MRRSRVAALMMPALAVTLASCGRVEGPPLYPVQGKVIFKGQPASGATVLFRREDPEPNTTPLVPTGLVDEEGKFTLAVDGMGGGAPAGKYAVLIQWRSRAEGAEEPKPAAPAPKKGRRTIVPDKPDGAPDRLQGRYMIAEKSPFHVEVKAGENNLEPFDVSK
jgi:hypothetical protein